MVIVLIGIEIKHTVMGKYIKDDAMKFCVILTERGVNHLGHERKLINF